MRGRDRERKGGRERVNETVGKELEQTAELWSPTQKCPFTSSSFGVTRRAAPETGTRDDKAEVPAELRRESQPLVAGRRLGGGPEAGPQLPQGL